MSPTRPLPHASGVQRDRRCSLPGPPGSPSAPARSALRRKWPASRPRSSPRCGASCSSDTPSSGPWPGGCPILWPAGRRIPGESPATGLHGKGRPLPCSIPIGSSPCRWSLAVAPDDPLVTAS